MKSLWNLHEVSLTIHLFWKMSEKARSDMLLARNQQGVFFITWHVGIYQAVLLLEQAVTVKERTEFANATALLCWMFILEALILEDLSILGKYFEYYNSSRPSHGFAHSHVLCHPSIKLFNRIICEKNNHILRIILLMSDNECGENGLVLLSNHMHTGRF